MNKKIIIYTTPTCTYCKMTKEFLGENKIAYEEKDVTTDEVSRNEMIQKSGQMGVPVVDIEGEIIVGFNKDKLAELLSVS
jgi:glutaredoxin 3